MRRARFSFSSVRPTACYKSAHNVDGSASEMFPRRKNHVVPFHFSMFQIVSGFMMMLKM